MKIFQESRIYDRLAIIIILIILILYSVYISFTPLYEDDYTYLFIYAPDDIIDFFPRLPVISAYTDNFAGVSRFIPHLVIGFFHYMGKIYFDIISGIIFVLFGLMTAKAATNRHELILPLTLISCSALFFIFNGFFIVAAWMSGVPNYILSAILVSIYIIIFKNYYKITNIEFINNLLYFIVGFIVG